MSSRNLFLPFSSIALALVCLSSATFGQKKDIADLANQMESRVEQSLQKYRVLQEEIAAEKVPLIQLINELENQVIEMRGHMRSIRSEEERAREELRAQRLLTGDLRTQNDYVSGLFAQYLNTYEGRLNIAEDQRLSALLNPYREAIELAGPGTQEAREKRTEAVEICLQRLELISGGYSFGGQALESRLTMRNHANHVVFHQFPIFVGMSRAISKHGLHPRLTFGNLLIRFFKVSLHRRRRS